MLFGPYWTKGKVANGLILAIRNNIVTKKTTELVLLFYKNITKLVFQSVNKNIEKYCLFCIKITFFQVGP